MCNLAETHFNHCYCICTVAKFFDLNVTKNLNYSDGFEVEAIESVISRDRF